MRRTFVAIGMAIAALFATPLPSRADGPIGRTWDRDYFLNDVAGDFLDFWADTEGSKVDQRVRAFRDRFEPAHRKFMDAMVFSAVRREDFYARLLPAFVADLTFHPQRVDSLRRAKLLYQSAIPRLANRLQTCFAPGELSLDRPFVLGLDFGGLAERIAPLDGRQTLWIGVSPDDDGAPVDLPIATDMFKLLRQDQVARRAHHPTVGVGYTAFLDGAAAYFAAEQVEGFTDREAIGYSRSDWVDALGNQRDIVYEVLLHFESDDPTMLRRYTASDPGTKLLPPRAADFVGFQAMRRLRRSYSWDEIIHWDDDTVRARLDDALAVI
jgi:hypothetical protein